MEQLEHLLPVQNSCDETPMWVPEEKALFWVDTGGLSVYHHTPADGCCTRFPTPLDSQALARHTAREWSLLSPYGVSLWEPSSNHCRFLGNPVADEPHLQFCDCAVDPRGRLIAGTFNADRFEAPDGA